MAKGQGETWPQWRMRDWVGSTVFMERLILCVCFLENGHQIKLESSNKVWERSWLVSKDPARPSSPSEASLQGSNLEVCVLATNSSLRPAGVSYFGGSRCSSTADSTEWRSTIEIMEIEKIGERVCKLCWVDWKSCFLLNHLVSRKSSLAWLVCNSHLDLRSRPNHLQLHRKKSVAWFTFWKIGVVHIMLQKIGKMVKAKNRKS